MRHAKQALDLGIPGGLPQETRRCLGVPAHQIMGPMEAAVVARRSSIRSWAAGHILR